MKYILQGVRWSSRVRHFNIAHESNTAVQCIDSISGPSSHGSAFVESSTLHEYLVRQVNVVHEFSTEHRFNSTLAPFPVPYTLPRWSTFVCNYVTLLNYMSLIQYSGHT